MIFRNSNEEFHLTNGKISYIFRVTEKTEVLEQLYFGESIPHMSSFSHLIEREIRPTNNFIEGDHTSSCEHVKQELPVYGTTDFRYPAVEIKYPDGDLISHFSFVDYHVSHEKKKIPHLPTTYAMEDEAETLTVILKDKYSSLTIELDYTIFKKYPVLTRKNRIYHSNNHKYSLSRFMSFNLDLPESNYDWIHLDGAWAIESQLKRDCLHSGVQQISSTRGASSHIHNPFFAICSKNTDEFQGEVYGFSLIYSGNFIGQIEVDTYNVARVQMGINPYQFNWILEKDQPFHTPEAVMVFTKGGLNEMSQTFHKLFQEHLIRQQWAKKERSVLINNWEATYFNFDEEKIMEIVKEAAPLGIELFVLDDGWFGQRNDDTSSLGDWRVNTNKSPNGIRKLAEKIEKAGLKFGLWFEPEMVSKGTSLYNEHPEWVVGHSGKNISHGRNQYVLDFSQESVVACIFEQMDKLLSTSRIFYLKWDMNRYISEAFSDSLGSNRQGEFFHRYILGVYSLLE